MASDNGDSRSRNDELSNPGLLILVLLAIGAAAVILYYAIWGSDGVEVGAMVLMILFGLVPLVVGAWIIYSTIKRLMAGKHP